MPAVVRFDRFRAGSAWTPAVDIFDAADAIRLKAELPGLSPEQIDIEVDENVLTLRGERRLEEAVEEGRYYRLERSYGSFQRSVTLPQGVKADEITADFEDGVLTVRVPKADEVAPRKIAVGAGVVEAPTA